MNNPPDKRRDDELRPSHPERGPGKSPVDLPDDVGKPKPQPLGAPPQGPAPPPPPPPPPPNEVGDG